MYCPNCGKANSAEQKFCRSCGLNLEGTTRSLVEQLPAEEQDQRLVRRKLMVERIGMTLGVVGITAFVALIIGTIITEIIIDKGQVVGGLVFIAFMLAAGFAGLLVIYHGSLEKAIGKSKLPASDTRPLDEARRQLADAYFEPAPSVTEPTTELLKTESKERAQSNPS